VVHSPECTALHSSPVACFNASRSISCEPEQLHKINFLAMVSDCLLPSGDAV
jgi:hypothetical protein